ncbi:MAG: hypothetical protein HY714_04580 [Candidatus Omnitrophica bacterium]|nr:hypothetical protein [Candidatus Omnitrophota bacterium]
MSSDTQREDLKRYEEAVRNKVCPYCVDFGADGICHSKDPSGCAILRFLPELVAIAKSIHELKIDAYAEAVKKNICMKCRTRKPGDHCMYRDTLDCGLDRYIPLIIQAIEDAA